VVHGRRRPRDASRRIRTLAPRARERALSAEDEAMSFFEDLTEYQYWPLRDEVLSPPRNVGWLDAVRPYPVANIDGRV
ncbi:MAG: hypothetical protein KC586_30370, partial [Myxococcales bacterium]|nr:hypothetical protein [Myxococcales bacterium]